MKKTTLMLCAFITTAGIMSAQQAQMPAAYYDTSTSASVQDLAFPANVGPRIINENLNVPFTGNYGATSGNRMADVIYDNGPYFNVAGTPNLSVLESETLGMGTYGPAASYVNGYSLADDVILTESYEISSIDLFAYQTNEVAPTIFDVYLQVWDGDPSAGGSIIWGDLVTGLFGGAEYSGANRVLETDQNNPNRQINRVTANTDGLILDPGTYWIEFSFEGSGASGPWGAPIAILGQATTGNAMQNNGTEWTILEDGGTVTPYGLPFVMYGSSVVGISDNALAGFNYYPNPTTDIINLKANSNIEAVSLYNLLGQKVMDVKVGAVSSQINLVDLATGAYLMQVTVDGQVGTYRITKN